MDGLCTEMGKENNNTCPDEPSLIRGFCDEKTCKATYYEGVHCPSATNELGCKNLRNWYEMNCKESGKNCAGAPWQKNGKPFLKNFCQSDQNTGKCTENFTCQWTGTNCESVCQWSAPPKPKSCENKWRSTMDVLCSEMAKENKNTCPDVPGLIRGFCDNKTCKATYYEGVHCTSATNELGCKTLGNWYVKNCEESGKNCAGASWQKNATPFLKTFCQPDQTTGKCMGSFTCQWNGSTCESTCDWTQN